MKKRWLAVGLLSLLGCLPFLACGGSDKPASGTSVQPLLAPVLTVKAEAGPRALKVPLAITNSTDRVVRYAWKDSELGLLDAYLYKNGQLVEEGLIPSGYRSPLRSSHVKELKPGETFRFWCQPPYSRVKPGLYELRFEYPFSRGAEEELGLTPMKLEQSILLDVQE